MADENQTPESGAEQPEGSAPQYSPDELQDGAAATGAAGADVNLWASDDTAEGRAQNRRVDVVLIN